MPKFVDGVDTDILNPRDTWDDKDAYDLQAQKLVKMFSDNFDAFKDYLRSLYKDALYEGDDKEIKKWDNFKDIPAKECSKLLKTIG